MTIGRLLKAVVGLTCQQKLLTTSCDSDSGVLYAIAFCSNFKRSIDGVFNIDALDLEQDGNFLTPNY